ncbi:hypothetical protein [Sphingomicrobium aestuariivivum]|uniref:hypothetical protein n=1 Tax=Sphingomicrobium aestuariivivum TaxID=1582356 RepID=UPI001FD70A01|nr:hypothetical protein [Sphingomicrobium aestuariivivum]MCJ8192035.1 hypothetical protein [Sphingomicrobium aestuariivivum]
MRYFCALLAIALAAPMALVATSNIQGAAPDWVESLNGFRIGEKVLERAAPTLLEPIGDPDLAPALIEDARTAYAREPFATDALFVIAESGKFDGHAIQIQSQNLEKRNIRIALALLEKHTQRFDLEAMGPLLDQISRLRPEASEQYAKALLLGLNDPSTFEWLAGELANEPGWAMSFWRSPPKNGPALDNFLMLRLRQTKVDDQNSDLRLVQKLVSAGRYDDAFDLHELIKEQSRGDETSLAYTYPPLDWQLMKGRDANARMTVPDHWTLYINDGTAGLLAERLVPLRSGQLRVEGELRSISGQGELRMELQCAGPDGGERASQPFAEKAIWVIDNPKCGYAWLRLQGAAWDSSVPFKATLRGVKITH